MITPREYKQFQRAYDWFNRELFEGSLPQLLITLQRRAGRGYFWPERFHWRELTTTAPRVVTAHELALNPDAFTGRTDEEILSTLVHEMVHVWQEHFGRPPRRSYHNRDWAAKMRMVGLQPSDTGKPGGKETGQSVSHFIVEGGAFARSFAKLRARGFSLQWQSRPGGYDPAKKASKTRFTCLACGQNAWAIATAKLVCGYCGQLMLREVQPVSG